MADTWWHEETKLLIALWDEEAVHNFDTMPNKKLVWDQVITCVIDQNGGHVVARRDETPYCLLG